MASYDGDLVRAYFDRFAESEWERLVKTPEAEVNLAVHRYYLRQNLQQDWRVLEVGAGAGRFTIELAKLGCRVVVTDISPVQLELNREKVAEAGWTEAVEDSQLVDVVEMAGFEDDSFDALVCYGGPLSYVLDRREEALAECIRVTKPGGPLLFSVMSLWGSVHSGLPFVLSVPREANEAIIATGDITAASLPGHEHYCHAFRGTEFRDLLERAGLEIEVLSAATSLSTAWRDRLDAVRTDPDRWDELVAMEIQACAEPGMVEAGRHMIAVARLPAMD
jgi:SAM-dependent methyltransferase